MNWIRKYWHIILALVLVLGFIFVPFVQTVLFYSLLILMLFFGKYPLIFFITIASIIILLFILARRRDLAHNRLKKKIWIMRHIRQLVVVVIAILGLTFWGFKAMEKSENELFNRLVEIMENNVPTSKTSYNKDISELVCPLVDADKLTKMMQDKYAKKRMEYFDYPYSISGRDGDERWKISLKSRQKNKVPSFSTLDLIIIINKMDGKCNARIRNYPFGA